MRLRELRKERGISQLKLAMDLNMNQIPSAAMKREIGKPDMKSLLLLLIILMYPLIIFLEELMIKLHPNANRTIL